MLQASIESKLIVYLNEPNKLDDEAKYDAVLYKDAPDAHWDDNPTAIEIEEVDIDTSTEMTFNLAEGGGFAISLLKR
jgi:hypothetical protein